MKPAVGKVRIIGGRWRGTRLPVPERPGLRPTTDRVRETLFNWLQPMLPGARVLDRTVEGLLGHEIWAEFPEAVGSPFEQTYRQVRRTGTPGSLEAWFGPLEKWFRADAFLTDAGLVVTYDDVTARRASDEERVAAVAAREEAVSAAAASAGLARGVSVG